MPDETPNPHVKAKEIPPVADSKAKDDDQDPATHDLHLADGSVVESRGGIPSHVAVGDRVIRVLHAQERQ